MSRRDGLKKFARSLRKKFKNAKEPVRVVKVSEFEKDNPPDSLAGYIGQKVPFYYRPVEKITDELKFDQAFFATIQQTLGRLPDVESFQESHFGEITATIFSEEILGFKKIYSKLAFLSAENTNAHKMDIILYDPNSDPIEFYLGEVKCSPKTLEDKDPPEHHKSCYKSLFDSLNGYSKEDLDFDLGAIKDRLSDLDERERKRIKKALRPYGEKSICFSGFVLIDLETRIDSEISVLSERSNDKDFEVEVICIENYAEVAKEVYSKIKTVRDSCFR